jgi:transposase InsO family protein
VLRRPVESGQYTALRFTQRLVDAGVAPSTGSTGDSFDNALAENLWSTIKVELMYWPGTTFATRAEAEQGLSTVRLWHRRGGQLGVSRSSDGASL